jgi:osmoprotectant transport system permease protein
MRASGAFEGAPQPQAGAPSRGVASEARDVPTLAFSAAGLVAALVLPFVRSRPNRIAEGIPQLLLTVDPAAAILLCALWLAAAALALWRAPQQVRARGVSLAAILAPLCAVVSAGLACGRLAAAGTPARVSLSAGFWITMFAGYAAFVTSSRQAAFRPSLRRALSLSAPAIIAALLVSGFLDAVSVMREYAVQKTVFAAEAGAHVVIAGSAVLIGGVIGIAAGVLAFRHPAFKRAAFFVLNIVQTIPSLALFGLLILPLAALSNRFPLLHQWGISGIGRAPALIALSFYAMLPIARNTHTGLDQIPQALREAGFGMGMTRLELLARVEVPLALPVILAGVRTSAVQAVGNTVVTALIGAGGLGIFIFQGLGQFASDMILLGTLPVIAMAVVVDAVMAALVRLLTPRALRGAAA